MAGFLDKRERVIDMILTDHGRDLLSRGKLEFAYYSFFDDEVDYQPCISTSGSMSSAELSASVLQQIEATLVREATTGYRSGDMRMRDTTNVHDMLFTVPQGQTIVPEMELVPDVLSGSVGAKQRKVTEVTVKRDNHGRIREKIGEVDLGFEKFEASSFVIELGLTDMQQSDGYLVETFLSGTEGLRRLESKRDADGVLSYLPDVRVHIDEGQGVATRAGLEFESLDRRVGVTRK